MISTSERSARARAIAEAAFTYPPEKRAAFLARACSEDPELGSLVLTLLQDQSRGDGLPDEPLAVDFSAPAKRRSKIVPSIVAAAVLALGGMLLHTMTQRNEAQEASVRAHATADRLSDLVESSVDVLERTEPAAADSVLRSLLDLRLEALGHGHPSVRQVRRDLARIAARSGSFTRAESLRREQVSEAEERFGPFHTEVADDLVDLGELLLSEGKLVDASTSATRAIEIYGRNEEGTGRLGEAHHLLARTQLEDDDRTAAEASLHAAVGALRSVGERSRSLATALEDLGRLYAGDSRPSDAAVVWKDAVDVRRGDSSGDPLDLARALSWLAGARAEAGEPDEAAGLWAEAVGVYRTKSSSSDPRTLNAMTEYGVLLSRMGRPIAAEPLFQEVIKNSRRATSRMLARSYTSLGYLYHDEDRLPRAETHLRLALDHQLESIGLYHESTASCMIALADVLRDLCRADESERLYDHALAVCDSIFDEPHPVRSAGLVGLGSLLTDSERTTEAEPLLRQAQVTSELVLGPTHPETLAVGTTLAMCLSALGDDAEAAKILQANLTELTRCCGPEDPETVRAHDALFELLPDTP